MTLPMFLTSCLDAAELRSDYALRLRRVSR